MRHKIWPQIILKGKNGQKGVNIKIDYLNKVFHWTVAFSNYFGSIWEGTTSCKTIWSTMTSKGQNGVSKKMVPIENRQYLKNGASGGYGYY